MKIFLRIVSVLISIVLVVLTLQFNIGKAIIHYIGIAATGGTTTIVIYVIIDSLREWWREWRENAKNKKK